MIASRQLVENKKPSFLCVIIIKPGIYQTFVVGFESISFIS